MAKLQRQQPLLSVISGILQRQLQLIESNRLNWCRTQDAEALHDLRVAVRRSRTVLGQLRHELPDVAWFRAEMAWMGEISGPLRDLDVFRQVLLALPQGTAGLREDTRTAVLHILKREQQKAVSELLPLLESERSVEFVSHWAAELERWGTSGVEQAALGKVCDRQIDKNLCKLLKKGRAFSTTAADEQYHRLRIRGKKLRYLLEFFADLYPADLVPQLVKELKKQQDVLGHFQDFAVWRRWLEQVQIELGLEQYRELDQLTAAQQQVCRYRVTKIFKNFVASAVRCELQALLKA
jgi:CHAD domain-containing protein